MSIFQNRNRKTTQHHYSTQNYSSLITSSVRFLTCNQKIGLNEDEFFAIFCNWPNSQTLTETVHSDSELSQLCYLFDCDKLPTVSIVRHFLCDITRIAKRLIDGLLFCKPYLLQIEFISTFLLLRTFETQTSF